jgi:hypothetical protein
MYFLENEILQRNFKGEPWAVPRRTQWHAKTTRRRSSLRSAGFLTDVRPLMQLVRILGLLPLHFESNGKLRHSLKRPILKTQMSCTGLCTCSSRVVALKG